MPRYTTLTDNELRPVIIERLAENSTSMTYRKQLANELGVRVDFVNNVYNHSKQQINSLRVKIYEEERKSTSNGEFMLIDDKKEETSVVETEEKEQKIIQRTKEDYANRVKLTDEQKFYIAKQIEDNSEYVKFADDERRYISYDMLKMIAQRNNITIITAEKYCKEYTSVSIDKEHRLARIPDFINKRFIPQEKKDLVDELLRTTTLHQYEIANIAGVNSPYVSKYFTTNNIERPAKEDEEVKKKTAKYRHNAANNIKKAAEQQREKKDNIDLAAEKKVEEKKPEIVESKVEKSKPKPVTAMEIALGKADIKLEDNTDAIMSAVDTVVSEIIDTKHEKEKEESRLNLYDVLGKDLHFIETSDVFECVLVDKRHMIPCRIAVFSEELDTDLMFDYDRQYQHCVDFLKSNLKFNADGVPDRAVKLYCTGLQSPLISFIKACVDLKVNLTCMHHNNDESSYFPQEFNTSYPIFNNLGPGITAIAKTFGKNIYSYKCFTNQIENCKSYLNVIVCNDGTDNHNAISAIVCNMNVGYKEAFTTLVGYIILNKVSNYSIEVHKFNFDSKGEIFKNEIVAEYKTK